MKLNRSLLSACRQRFQVMVQNCSKRLLFLPIRMLRCELLDTIVYENCFGINRLLHP